MSLRKRLLLVNHSPEKYGGANDDFLRLLKHLYKYRNKYFIVGMFPDGKAVPEYSKYCDETRIYTAGFFPVTSSSVLEYAGIFKVYLSQKKEVRDYIKKGKFDLIILNVVVLLWLIVWSGKYSNTLVFVREKILPDSLRKYYFKFIARYGKYFIAVSKSLEDDYKSITGRANIETINSAVENDDSHLTHAEEWQSYIERNGFQFMNNPDENVFFCLGALCDRKNQMLILETAALLPAGDTEKLPHFVFIGDDTEGSYRRSMEQYISERKLSGNCHVLGPLPRELFYNQMPKLKGVIISSKSEGLPLVVSEAMRFGVPLITTNVGGIGDIVKDGYNGLIIEDSPESLRVAVTRLTDEPLLASKLSENGKTTFSKEFNLDNNLNRFTRIIDRLIQ